MPSHPDRVRRHYEPADPPLSQAQLLALWDVGGRVQYCAACGRYHLPGIGPECPYRGVTANVIEGEHL
jgi:hypothetical protein